MHRVGHGIGQEAHEDPYMVAGNVLPLAAGHAFSVEPGIYVEGRFGMRLEDIVVATDAGPAPPQRRAARPRAGRLIESLPNVKLDGATFLLQWAAGGLAFLWVTTRRREVSLGYGWLLRGIYGLMAAGAVALFATQELTVARSIALAGSVGGGARDRGRARSSRSCAGGAACGDARS